MNQLISRTCKFAILAVMVLVEGLPSSFAHFIADEYPLVRDGRNFKESKGGKGVPPQGRILEDSIRHFDEYSERTPPEEGQRQDRSYIISMNCRRGDRTVLDIVEEVKQKLLPENELHRLGIIIGINEKVGIDHPLGFEPTWSDLLGSEDDRRVLGEYGIPLLVTYYQWSSFREHRDDPRLSASEVRRRIMSRLDDMPDERQKRKARQTLRKQDAHQSFPFGKARGALLESASARRFIAQFDSNESEVYIHIQDSDFVSFQETLEFANFQGVGANRLIPTQETHLLGKYDHVLDLKKAQNERPVVIMGGAHVYSPEEDLTEYLDDRGLGKLNTLESKYWTRFGSEMGNAFKHIIGAQQPYGLYFHEPNTLILSPTTAMRLAHSEQDSAWRNIYAKLARGFVFGIDSELQDFTRTLFSGASDAICRAGMVFSSTTVLSTSMKRGQKPFTIYCGGTYHNDEGMFSEISASDLTHLRGMSQEIMHPNKWMSNVATSFKAHRTQDARKQLCQLINVFDPAQHVNPRNKKSYVDFLINYDAYLEKRRQDIRKLFLELSELYNAQGRGTVIAEQIMTLAWECGQAVRFMILDYVQPPKGIDVKPKTVGEAQRLHLEGRFNFADAGDEPLENPFINGLLADTPGTAKASSSACTPKREMNEDYSKTRYTHLIGFLKMKVSQGSLNYQEITTWAGYSGMNGARDFKTMARTTYRKKSGKWAQLIKRLKTQQLLEEFSEYENQQ